MSISSILIYIYLFFGLIIAALILVASYNIYTKGYRATSAFIGILIFIFLFGLSFGSAITSIRSFGIDLENATKSTTPTPNKATPTATPKGKFY